MLVRDDLNHYTLTRDRKVHSISTMAHLHCI